MKISISKESLVDALDAVQGLAGGKIATPVLSSVLLVAEGGRLFLTATDTYTTITASVPASVAVGGSSLLPAKKFYSIVKDLSPQDMTISIDEKSHATIKSGRAVFKLHGAPDDEFPDADRIEGGATVKVSQARIKSALRRVAFSVCAVEDRANLCGVSMKFAGADIELASTDGRRMSRGFCDADSVVTSTCECLVPIRPINEILRLLQETGEAEIVIGDNKISVALTGAEGELPVKITTSLVAARFPDITPMIPAADKCHRATFSREELQTVIGRVANMTNELSHSLKFSFSRNQVEITANAPDMGEAAEIIECLYDGPEIKIAFGPQYLLDPLRVMPEDSVFMDLTDDRSPMAYRTEADAFTFVVMPVRLS